MYKIRYCLQFGCFKGIGIIWQLFVLKKGLAKIQLPGFTYPIFLRRGTSDIKVFEQIFIYREYDIPIHHKVAFILDGGSNIGLSAIFFKHKFPDATIVCIEPESNNFNILQKNTAGYTDIVCLKKGLWNKQTWLQVADTFNMGNWGFICSETTNPNQQAI